MSRTDVPEQRNKNAALKYAAQVRGAKLVTTTGLGHGRILRDAGVIAEVIRFIGVGRS